MSVRYAERDGIAHVTIDREARRNALDRATIAGLRDAFARASATPHVAALVLTGAGERAFCSGADLSPEAASFETDPASPTTPYADLLRAAYACPVPVIGRINGHCLAGGMGLLAICDVAVAAAHATFGLPEVKVGLFPMQVLAVLRPLLPPRALAELALTGEPLDAPAALAAGLVNYVVPGDELDAKVAWLAARFTGKSIVAQRRGKHAMRASAAMSFDQALAYLETQIATLAQTEDAREGRRAFAERRAPQWSGR